MATQIFYDIVSPYSYLALSALQKLHKPWNVELKLRPFLIGGVMVATENKPPGSNPFKSKYMLKDLNELAQLHFHVPLKDPEGFPHNTMNVMRLLVALQEKQPDKVMDASMALFSAYWGHGQDITNATILSGVLAPNVLSPQLFNELTQMVQTQAVKDRLKANTEEAVKRGAFGAPTMFVTSANQPTQPIMYFGSDRLHLIALQLGTTYPSQL